MAKRDEFNDSLVPHELRGDGRVVVPKTYQSDQAPILRLRDLKARVNPPNYYERVAADAPLRISLELDGNAEAVRRLAQLFGLYGSADEWNRMAKAHGLPMVPEAPALPSPSAERIGLLRPGELAKPCARCGHAWHDGWCPSCEDDSSCMGPEFVEEP